VVVAPEFDKSRKTKVLPLHGVVSPRTENTIETGVGYSTDVGPRVRTSWKKPWMNSYGHSLTTSLSLSAPEQQLDFSYKMPLLKNPLEQYYLVQGGFKRTDLNDTKQDSTTLAVSRSGISPAAGSAPSTCAGAWTTLPRPTSPTPPCCFIRA
jgi:translocation and assembly module TamA